jgi:tRNA-dihydrouridine synthase A
VNKTFSIAPMLDLTDRHCRAFFRLFSGNIRLYTEMIVVGSIIHGDRDRFLGFDTSEHPVALQLGGCDPGKLGICAQLAEERGYDEVNLNIGCPSDRVKSARFGACLMARPQLVADCVSEMIRSVAIPVTVKTRIGIDDQDSYEYLAEFIETVSAAGCKHFIVHARKAWLTGLSPKENRTVPPLHYDRVYKLKEDFPGVAFTLNGGITSIEQIETHLPKVDGVMIGREAYRNPWILKQMDDHFFKNDNSELPGENKIITRHEIVEAYLPYIEKQLSQGVYLRHMTRHMLGLFQGQGGAKGWRRHLSEYGPRKNAGIEVIQEALKFVDPDRKQAEYGDRVAYG